MARGGSLLSGLIGGAVAGTVEGLLLAPKAGKESREIVRDKGGKYVGKSGEIISNLRDRFHRESADEEVADSVSGGVYMAKGGSLLTGLTGGAIAGVVAGLLLAPKTGKEAREIVRDKGGTYVGKSGEYISKGGEYITNLRDRFHLETSDEEVAESVDTNQEAKSETEST